MQNAEDRLRELWVEEWKAVRAYAYRATQKILAGHKKNPLFPPADMIEELSADAIAEAYETTTKNAERIMAWQDETKRRKVLLAFVRNGCRHSITRYRKSRCHRLESDIAEREENLADGFEELILSLPPAIRRTAELLAKGKTQSETAEELGVSRREIYRRREQLRGILGFDLFCRWIARCFA
jgi:hypothetical protein